jgi:hypothetical protein
VFGVFVEIKYHLTGEEREKEIEIERYRGIEI